MDARKQATEAATEIKSTKLKIDHLEKEIQAKSKHLKVRTSHSAVSCWALFTHLGRLVDAPEHGR
jgi:hypothetical protein